MRGKWPRRGNGDRWSSDREDCRRSERGPQKWQRWSGNHGRGEDAVSKVGWMEFGR